MQKTKLLSKSSVYEGVDVVPYYKKSPGGLEREILFRIAPTTLDGKHEVFVQSNRVGVSGLFSSLFVYILG